MSILITQLVARVIADTVEFNAGMAQVQAKTAETAAATNRSVGTQGSAARRMSTLSKVALGGAAIAIAKSVQSFADYDRQMNITQRITGANEGQMKSLRAEAIKLGADVKLPGVSASDVAKGMQELGRAGFSAEGIMKSIRGTMMLGTAGQLDYADAAKITAQAINTFGLNTGKAGHVADLFAASANASQAEVGDIADAFRYSASQAQQAGVGIDDLTLLIAKLSNSGVEASVAGTALRAMFTRLAPHTLKQTEAWQKLGLATKDGKSKFFDAQGQFIGIHKAADLYANSMKGLTREQRVNLSYQAFGVAATRGFFNAFKGGSKGLDDLHKKFHTNGAAQRVAAANAKGLYGAMQALTNVVQTLGLLFGQALAPYVIVAANAFSAMLAPLIKHQTILKVVAAAIAYLVIGLAAFKTAALITAVVNGAAMESFLALNAAILSNPLGLIVIAIVGIILILRHFGVSLDDVTKFVKRAFQAWLDGAMTVIGWFKKNWQEIAMWILLPFPMLVKTIINHWGEIKVGVKKAVSAIWTWIVKRFWDIVHFIENLAPIAYKAAHDLGSQIAQGVLDGMGSLAEKINKELNPFSRIPGVDWAGKHLGQGAQWLWTNGETIQPGSHIIRPHATLHPRSSPRQAAPSRAPSRSGAAVHIEHMHVRNEAEAHTLATVLGRKVVAR